MEKRYTKEEIIAMYFNEFDFLNTAVGIHAAARVYFNKEAHELNIQESAMLVGMAKNPTIYNPSKKTRKHDEEKRGCSCLKCCEMRNCLNQNMIH